MENGEAVTHDDFYYVGYSCTHPTSADPSNANPVFSGQDVMMTSAGAAHLSPCDPAMVDEMHMHMFAVGTQQYDRS